MKRSCRVLRNTLALSQRLAGGVCATASASPGSRGVTCKIVGSRALLHAYWLRLSGICLFHQVLTCDQI